MGLKVRHNGIISDLSGSEYEPGSLGTKRLKIRTGAGVKEYGLTTDPNATSYCGLNFKIDGQKYFIGRRFSTSGSTQSTMQGTATRSSQYDTGEYRNGNYSYTYTYEESNTYTTSPYSYKYTGSTVWASTYGTYITRTSQQTTDKWSGAWWVRVSAVSFWIREYASTNGVKTGGYNMSSTDWYSGAYTLPIYTRYLTSTLTRTDGTLRTEYGSFVGNRTSVRLDYAIQQSRSSSYEVTSAVTSAVYGTINSRYSSSQATSTSSSTTISSVAYSPSYPESTKTAYIGPTQIGQSSGEQYSGIIVRGTHMDCVSTLGATSTNWSRRTGTAYTSRSWITFTSSRQSDYTYQSDYTTSVDATSHNFV